VVCDSCFSCWPRHVQDDVCRSRTRTDKLNLELRPTRHCSTTSLPNRFSNVYRVFRSTSSCLSLDSSLLIGIVFDLDFSLVISPISLRAPSQTSPSTPPWFLVETDALPDVLAVLMKDIITSSRAEKLPKPVTAESRVASRQLVDVYVLRGR
jgi:hypothetical protein